MKMKIYRNYIVIIYIMLFFALFLSCDSETDPTGTGGNPAAGDSTMIIDHTACDLSQIPQQAIEDAKSNLIIAYGHTSHGSQLVEGMKGLIGFADSLYSFNGDGSGGALQLRDYAFGIPDLGNPDRTSWEEATRTYLDSHAEVNVVIWSWCGQVSSADEGEIDLYLSLMNGLDTILPILNLTILTVTTTRIRSRTITAIMTVTGMTAVTPIGLCSGRRQILMTGMIAAQPTASPLMATSRHTPPGISGQGLPGGKGRNFARLPGHSISSYSPLRIVVA
jgi:hypothetical protein